MTEKTMSITLKPELEKRVREKVSSGAYRSSDEVLQAGLRLLDEQDRMIVALRADVQIGIDQLDRGEGIDADVVFEDLRAQITKPEFRGHSTQL